MSKRAASREKKQRTTPIAMTVGTQRLMLPLLLAMDATKKGLLAFVQQMGMVVLSELLTTEATQIAGPKSKRIKGRTHHHWWNGEVTLPSVESRREGDSALGARRSAHGKCRATTLRTLGSLWRCAPSSSPFVAGYRDCHDEQLPWAISRSTSTENDSKSTWIFAKTFSKTACGLR